jgi:3-methyladenine DNA glycosylase Tag
LASKKWLNENSPDARKRSMKTVVSAQYGIIAAENAQFLGPTSEKSMLQTAGLQNKHKDEWWMNNKAKMQDLGAYVYKNEEK